MRLTQVRTAWLWLVVALALHVIDEAFDRIPRRHNPTVQALRDELRVVPDAGIRFDVWVAGLADLILAFALRHRWSIRSVGMPAATSIAGLMVLDGVAQQAPSPGAR